MYMYTMSPCWAEAQMPFFTRFQPLGRNWWYWAGCLRHTNVEGFLKWGYPKMDGLYWTITLRWMIWGVPPHFRKPLYDLGFYPFRGDSHF